MITSRSLLISLVTLLGGNLCFAATAGKPSRNELPIVSGNRAQAIIMAAPNSGVHEKRAAEDLAKYIEMITGVRLDITKTPQAISAAMQTKMSQLVLDQKALKIQPDLQSAWNAVLKKKPHLRADGIVLQRSGNHLYVTGNNDLSHYFAVAELLRLWGC